MSAVRLALLIVLAASAATGESASRSPLAVQAAADTTGDTGGLDLVAFGLSVRACWNLGDPLAAATRVTVGFALDPDGRVMGNAVHMVSGHGADEAAALAAHEAARRAILRCQGKGYDLPPKLHDLWREIEMTFDPAAMALR
jgi:hypothetical protein